MKRESLIACLTLFAQLVIAGTDTLKIKSLKTGLELNYTQLTFKNVMPYYRSKLSYEAGAAFTLRKQFISFPRIAFCVALGAGYRQYKLDMPDLNHFNIGPNFYWLPRKDVFFRYVNCNFSFSFQYKINKRASLGAGSRVNYLYMPEKWYIHESYSFPSYTYYYGGMKRSPVTQTNAIYYKKTSLLPNLKLNFQYLIGEWHMVDLEVAASLITQVAGEPYGAHDYYGPGGSRSINAWWYINGALGVRLGYSLFF